jgi:hypothetical protein
VVAEVGPLLLVVGLELPQLGLDLGRARDATLVLDRRVVHADARDRQHRVVVAADGGRAPLGARVDAGQQLARVGRDAALGGRGRLGHRRRGRRTHAPEQVLLGGGQLVVGEHQDLLLPRRGLRALGLGERDVGGVLQPLGRLAVGASGGERALEALGGLGRVLASQLGQAPELLHLARDLGVARAELGLGALQAEHGRVHAACPG